jgi:hypothetical protein
VSSTAQLSAITRPLTMSDVGAAVRVVECSTSMSPQGWLDNVSTAAYNNNNRAGECRCLYSDQTNDSADRCKRTFVLITADRCLGLSRRRQSGWWGVVADDWLAAVIRRSHGP